MLAATAVAAPFAAAEDDLRDRQRKVERKIDRASDDLQESSAAAAKAVRRLSAAQATLDAAQAELARTRGELATARALDAQMQQKLEVAVANLSRARTELREGRRAVAEQRLLVDDTVARMYEGGGPDMAMIDGLLESRGLEDMTWALSSTAAISDEQDSALDSLEAAEVLLELREAKVEQRKEEVEVARREAAENLALRQRLEERAEQEAASVQRLVASRASAAREAARARARDRAVLAALRKEEDRIARMLRARAAAAAAAARKKGRTGGGGSSGGYLDYPVNGYVTSPFGYRTHPIYGYYSLHDGVDFGAGCGSPLYASASGRVVSRYYSSVWGNRLIVDHGYQRGTGLATIYNHATSYVVGSGQYVRRGQVVGYVGSTGWSTGCHLHFTVTSNGRPVDPMNWF